MPLSTKCSPLPAAATILMAYIIVRIELSGLAANGNYKIQFRMLDKTNKEMIFSSEMLA